MTGDIDFLLSNSPANQQKIRDALTNFGFASTLPPTGEPIVTEDRVLMLGRAPYRIDLLAKITGVSFSEAYDSRLVIEMDGLDVPVISPAMLLQNKRATGREKDAADARELEAWLSSKQNE